MFSYHDRARHKSPRTRQRVCKSFSNRPRSRKSITLTTHWNLANLVKIYHGPSYFDTTCIRDEWELLREQYAEYEKGRLLYSCIQGWMKSGGLILWNAIAICEMFKISWQMGKHFMKDDSENHLKAWSFRSVQSMVEYHPIFAKDHSRLQQLGNTVFTQAYFSDMH